MKVPRFSLLVLAFAWGMIVPPSRAMSVRAPTFPELVAESTTVARARIVSVSSHAVDAPDGSKVIKTFVTFATLSAIKGQPAAEFTLSFLGGAEKGERWVVPGMPTFERGEETFVFTSGEDSICPLVGAMHGRYRVLTDDAAGRRYVARDNCEPLRNTEEVVLPMEAPASVRSSSAQISEALTPEEFEKRIASEVANPSRRAAPR